MIENINEITEYLNTNKDNEEVIDFMKSIQQPLTRDVVETWCQDGDGRSWLDRNCDIYSNKAVKTAQEKAIAKYEKETLPTKIEEAIKAKSTEGLSPSELKLRELEQKLADMELEKQKAELLNVNTAKLKEKGLDIGLAKYINDDSDVDFFSNLISNSIHNGVKEKLGDSNYTPPKTDNNSFGKIQWQDVIDGKSSYEDFMKQENK